MQLTSRGIHRRRKTKEATPVTYFKHDESAFFSTQKSEVRVNIHNSKAVFSLLLQPVDVVTLLLKLPPHTIAEAVVNATNLEDAEYTQVPEILKELALGAMERQLKDTCPTENE